MLPNLCVKNDIAQIKGKIPPLDTLTQLDMDLWCLLHSRSLVVIKSCPYFLRVTRENLQKTDLSFFFCIAAFQQRKRMHHFLFKHSPGMSVEKLIPLQSQKYFSDCKFWVEPDWYLIVGADANEQKQFKKEYRYISTFVGEFRCFSLITLVCWQAQNNTVPMSLSNRCCGEEASWLKSVQANSQSVNVAIKNK